MKFHNAKAIVREGYSQFNPEQCRRVLTSFKLSPKTVALDGAIFDTRGWG